MIKSPAGSVLVHQEEGCVAIMDEYPMNPGHVVVTPRNHYSTITELPDELTRRIFLIVTELAKSIHKVTGADGVNVRHASVPEEMHVRIDVVPRFMGDRGPGFWPLRKRVDLRIVEELGEKIREELSQVRKFALCCLRKCVVFLSTSSMLS